MALQRKCCPQFPSPQARYGGQTQRGQPRLLSAVDRTARILNTNPGEHCHPSMCNHTSCLPFQLDLINSSSTATSAFPPQQGTDAVNCPKELGLCRIYHGFPLVAFPYCKSCQVPVQGTKVSPLLWEHSTLQLLKYSAHLHTIPGFADASQIPEQRKVFKSQCGISI